MSGSLTWNVGGYPSGLVLTTVKRVNQAKSPTDMIPVAGDFRAALNNIQCDALDPNFTPQTAVARNDGGTVDLFVVGTPSINSPGQTPPGQPADNTRVTVWLVGGSLNHEYLVSITVMTEDGQEITRSFIIPVTTR